MQVILALILAFSLISAAPSASAAGIPGETVKQLDLAKALIDTFGWSEGLPENPTEKDYRAILGGNRMFRFEAETIFDSRSDPVSVRTNPLFGPFTGSGWINGTGTAAAVHFRIFMPVTGNYALIVSGKGDEQLWSIAGRAFKVTFGDSLKEKKVGQLFIPSGYLDFNTLIPPAAGIDYLLFTAPAYAPIEPVAGWYFSAPLTAGALAETASSLLGNEHLLPEDTASAKTSIQASNVSLPLGAQLTTIQIFGKPVADKWVRASQVPVTLTTPVTVESNGIYHVRIRCMGTEISTGFGARKVTLPAKPYLEWVDFGTFRLQKGTQSLEILLPPSGGLDVIEIDRKLSTPTHYLAINKIGIKEDAFVRRDELDAVMKSLQEQFKERK